MGVTWQVGRTGKLTPVLHIEPTHIDGSTVSNVSLASAARFEELGLGRGDKVMVEKAGDIIPQVVRVTWRPLRSPKMEVPSRCPCCGSSSVRDGAHVFCRNLACSSKLHRRVLHWLDRMDVKGAGPSIVSAMCDLGIVKELPDLYYLKAEDLEAATGSRKVAEAIIGEIMSKSSVPLWKFMAALGVPSLGRTASKAIAKRYSSVDEAVAADVFGLSAIDGIGETTAQQIVDGLIAMAKEVSELEKVLDIEEPVTGGPLSGKSFCLTGAMSRGRKEIAADIEAAGGEVKSSVGKGLDFLVQADPSSKSGKTQKAEKYGTRVIGEEELMEMIRA
jgi:DNA ligase (NAD+)